jgi:hypothetical protein
MFELAVFPNAPTVDRIGRLKLNQLLKSLQTVPGCLMKAKQHGFANELVCLFKIFTDIAQSSQRISIFDTVTLRGTFCVFTAAISTSERTHGVLQ